MWQRYFYLFPVLTNIFPILFRSLQFYSVTLQQKQFKTYIIMEKKEEKLKVEEQNTLYTITLSLVMLLDILPLLEEGE